MAERPPTTLTLAEAARGLGVRSDSLRAQISRGRLVAERRGRDWHITPAEYDRYKTEVQLGRPSRSSGLDEVIQAIDQEFELSGSWPQTRDLQRLLAMRGFEVDLVEIGTRLDPSLGRIDRAGVAVLKLRGLLLSVTSSKVPLRSHPMTLSTRGVAAPPGRRVDRGPRTPGARPILRRERSSRCAEGWGDARPRRPPASGRIRSGASPTCPWRAAASAARPRPPVGPLGTDVESPLGWSGMRPLARARTEIRKSPPRRPHYAQSRSTTA